MCCYKCDCEVYFYIFFRMASGPTTYIVSYSFINVLLDIAAVIMIQLLAQRIVYQYTQRIMKVCSVTVIGKVCTYAIMCSV